MDSAGHGCDHQPRNAFPAGASAAHGEPPLRKQTERHGLDCGCVAGSRGRPGVSVGMNVIRGGLLFLFAFSVLAFGAVEVWSGTILQIGASLVFIGWAALVFLDDRIKIYW